MPIAATTTSQRRSSVTGLNMTPDEQTKATQYSQAPHHFPRHQAEFLARLIPMLNRHPDETQRPRSNLRAITADEFWTAAPVSEVSVLAMTHQPLPPPSQQHLAQFSYHDQLGSRVNANVVNVSMHDDSGMAEHITTIITEKFYEALSRRSAADTSEQLAANRASLGG